MPAMVEFATGLDLSPPPAPRLVLTPEPGSNPATVLVAFRRRLGADAMALDLQRTSNLVNPANWQTLVPGTAAAPILSRESHPDGTETITVRIEAVAPAFVRLRVLGP
jgi:hypothetical protein